MMPTDEGRRLSELRRSGAAGPHGKKTPDRANTEREAVDQAIADEVDDAVSAFLDEEWVWR
jgi:hypothetical protein